MDHEQAIIRLCFNTLKLAHVCTPRQLGELRPQTLERRLDTHLGPSANVLAGEVYALWLKQQQGKRRPLSDDVKGYCEYLHSRRQPFRKILELWDECVRRTDGPKSEAQRHTRDDNLRAIRDELCKYLGITTTELTAAIKKENVANDDRVAAIKYNRSPAPEGKQKKKILTTQKKILQEVQHTLDQGEKQAHSTTGSSNNVGRADLLQPGPHIRTPAQKKPPVVIDLTRDPWQKGVAQPLNGPVQQSSNIDMLPLEDYSQQKENWVQNSLANPHRPMDTVSGPGYICHACGLAHDHYITSCPSKTPGFWIRKKSASFLPPLQTESTFRKGPAAPSWTQSGFARPHVIQTLPDEQNPMRTISGTVRKRADEQNLEESSKRPRLGNTTSGKAEIQGLEPVRGFTSNRERPEPTEGRLSPWSLDSQGALDQDTSMQSRESRPDTVARLETESFLKEMAQGQEHRESDNLQGSQDGSPDVISIPDTPLSSPRQEHDPDESHLSLDDFSSPITPRTPIAIEFYITPKPFFQDPLYSPGVLSLFHGKPNPWVRKCERPSAIDFWNVPEETAPSATEIDADIISIYDSDDNQPEVVCRDRCRDNEAPKAPDIEALWDAGLVVTPCPVTEFSSACAVPTGLEKVMELTPNGEPNIQQESVPKQFPSNNWMQQPAVDDDEPGNIDKKSHDERDGGGSENMDMDSALLTLNDKPPLEPSDERPGSIRSPLLGNQPTTTMQSLDGTADRRIAEQTDFEGHTRVGPPRPTSAIEDVVQLDAQLTNKGEYSSLAQIICNPQISSGSGVLDSEVAGDETLRGHTAEDTMVSGASLTCEAEKAGSVKEADADQGSEEGEVLEE